MKVLVAGGRDFSDWQCLSERLDAFHAEHHITLLIHGAARGADSMASKWAFLRQVPTEEFAADWSAQGRAAGPIRNQKMLDVGKPDAVIIFPGGNGTADMLKRARATEGLRVVEV